MDGSEDLLECSQGMLAWLASRSFVGAKQVVSFDEAVRARDQEEQWFFTERREPIAGRQKLVPLLKQAHVSSCCLHLSYAYEALSTVDQRDNLSPAHLASRSIPNVCARAAQETRNVYIPPHRAVAGELALGFVVNRR